MKLYKVEIIESKKKEIYVAAKSITEVKKYINTENDWKEDSVFTRYHNTVLKYANSKEIKKPSDIRVEIPLEYYPYSSDENISGEYNLYEILWKDKIDKIWKAAYKVIKGKKYETEEDEESDYQNLYARKERVLKQKFNEERLK